MKKIDALLLCTFSWRLNLDFEKSRLKQKQLKLDSYYGKLCALKIA